MHLSLVKELACIAKDKRYPVYITHTKPTETEMIMSEIQRFDQALPGAVTPDIHWLHAGQEFTI